MRNSARRSAASAAHCAFARSFSSGVARESPRGILTNLTAHQPQNCSCTVFTFILRLPSAAPCTPRGGHHKKKADLPRHIPTRPDRRARDPRPHTSVLHTRTCPSRPTAFFLIDMRNARAPTPTRSTGFCVICICIGSSSREGEGGREFATASCSRALFASAGVE